MFIESILYLKIILRNIITKNNIFNQQNRFSIYLKTKIWTKPVI